MRVINVFIAAIRQLIFLVLVARQKEKFVNILNNWSYLYHSILEVSGQNMKTKREFRAKTKWIQAYFWTTVIILTSLYFVLTIFSNDYNSHLESPKDAFYNRILRARTALRLGSPHPNDVVSFSNCILAIWWTWVRGGAYLISTVIELLLNGVYPLTLWLGAKFFANTTIAKGTANLSKTKGKAVGLSYDLLKEYSDSMSQLAGSCYLLWIMNFAFRGMFNFIIKTEAGKTGSYIMMAYLVMTWTFGLTSLVLSAEVFKEVSYLMTEKYENQ